MNLDKEIELKIKNQAGDTMKIKIKEQDTPQTIINKISYEFNTFTDYLLFPRSIKDIKIESKTEVLDVLKLVRGQDDFIKLYEPYKNENLYKGISNSPLTKEQFLYLLLTAWIMFGDFYEGNLDVIFFLLQSEGIKYNENEIKRFLSEKDRTKKDIETALEEIKKNYKDELVFEKKIEKRKGVRYTDFIPEKSSSALYFKTDVDILNYFNFLILNSRIPFGFCKNYYKIKSDFKVPQSWLVEKRCSYFNCSRIAISMGRSISKPKYFCKTHTIPSYTLLENQLVLMVNRKKKITEERFNIENFTPVIISVEPDSQLQILTLIKSENGDLSQTDFYNEIIKTFPSMEFSDKKENELGTTGLFFVPDFKLNLYVFMDLCINDKEFKNFVVNESIKPVKKRGSEASWIHLYFYNADVGKISFSMSERTFEGAEPYLKNNHLFAVGSQYLRISVTGSSKENIKKFQVLFSKFLELYTEKKDKIIEIYKSYIPSFGKEEVRKEIVNLDKKVNKRLNLPVNIKGYARLCDAKRKPILDDGKHKGSQVLNFPREKGVYSVNYPSDGVNVQKYICPHETHPFPGLIKNNTENKDFPYLPCCFKVDQKDKNKYYLEYYNDIFEKPKETQQQEPIVTDKILKSGQYGVVTSSNLLKLFQIFDNRGEIKYFRQGVDRNPSSFLNTVQTLTEKDKEDVQTIRKKLVKLSLLAKQSCFNQTNEDIKNKLLDNNYYIDPSFFIKLLQDYYKVNIYLFNSKTMLLPNFIDGYFINTFYDQSIIVYEHIGTESNRAVYPQCEGIVDKEGKGIFPNNSPMGKGLREFFLKMIKSNTLQVENKIVPDNIFNEYKIVSQKIDSNGKCRKVDVILKDEKISFLTSPIPPLNVDIDEKIYQVDYSLIKNNFNFIKQNIKNNKCHQLVFNLSGITITVELKKDIDPLKGVEKKYELFYNNDEESELENFKRNKRIARYFCQYALWVFSHFLNDQEELAEENLDLYLNNFYKERCILIENYLYGNVEEKFSLENSSLIQDKKLILNSEEAGKRLMYFLRLYCSRNFDDVFLYTNKNNISNYYLDLSDFENFPDQVILQGKEVLEKWVNQGENKVTLVNDIFPVETQPYFFSNNLIENGKLFLAQNTNSLSKAENIAKTWVEKGYNPGYFCKEIETPLMFTLYFFKDKNNIKSTTISGEKNIFKIKIIDYQLTQKIFTVLLEV